MATQDAPSTPLSWDEAARRVLERETIYLRERLRNRVEGLVRGDGRAEVTLEDLDRARKMPSAMHAAPAAEPVAEPEWPISFGAYHVLDPQAAIAVCTLASESLMEEIAARHPAGVSVVGRVFTENFGVEKVVANVVANPSLRVLVLCGTESRHKVGETLLALHAGGVDAEGRVVGSSSPLPIVRSLSAEAVRLYQQKTEMVDLRGEEEIDAILAEIGRLAARKHEPWSERWEAPVPVLRFGVGGGAGMGGRFSPDPTGLFLIGIGPSGKTIHAEHYTREGVMDKRVIGERAEDVARTLLEENLVGDVRHAIYLGRELQKAETAIRLARQYEQDRDVELTGITR